MTLLAATMSLIDEDQGVCYKGHPCGLHIRSGHHDIAVRVCDTVHDDLDHEPYFGSPLVRYEITPEEVDMAERRGADPVMVEVARDFLRNRE